MLSELFAVSGGMVCSICDGDFDLEAEGGITGEIGIMPIALCPVCWNGLRDAFDMGTDCKHGVDCRECAEEEYA